jgi:hypothetical protein
MSKGTPALNTRNGILADEFTLGGNMNSFEEVRMKPDGSFVNSVKKTGTLKT